MTLKVAVAGTGYFSQFYYDAWSRLNDVRLVGAAPFDPKSPADIRECFGGDCVFALQRHVLSHLRDGTLLENSGHDYLANLEIEELIYRSAETGRFLRREGREKAD